ncbi:MAG: hypothetical protein AVDCRST_MAG89-5198 [uncultured Gemmatimonadetes bacterium]|uniref:Uncharacterized protein n=1 Tax=uncultured Gemmatimonadota bacterium TaxID=203437 RepID=A0A6J4N7Y6_9BACT|nr:MAG: hypothetical protein AVDCRST_MAG89-5198 [uncultured Gemmatimonadota bacterium]
MCPEVPRRSESAAAGWAGPGSSKTDACGCSGVQPRRCWGFVARAQPV